MLLLGPAGHTQTVIVMCIQEDAPEVLPARRLAGFLELWRRAPGDDNAVERDGDRLWNAVRFAQGDMYGDAVVEAPECPLPNFELNVRLLRRFFEGASAAAS